jgi:hypothetical protein
MRVMVIVKASKDSEATIMPSRALLAEMGAYNEQLIKAGLMKDGAGLKATSQGARIHFDGEARTVQRGPFPFTGDLVAGFWFWEVKSLDEAIEWAKKCPNPQPGTNTNIEIRPLYEESDFVD